MKTICATLILAVTLLSSSCAVVAVRTTPAGPPGWTKNRNNPHHPNTTNPGHTKAKPPGKAKNKAPGHRLR